MERRDERQLDECAGGSTPDGVEQLLGTHRWDAEEVPDVVLVYVMEHLGDPEAVLVVHQTGYLKQGRKSVGVLRQYSGVAVKVENCQVGAFGSRLRRTLPERELDLPQD